MDKKTREELLNKELPKSFQFMKHENYPFFSTIKQLVFMIDASLSKSFFKRDKDLNIVGADNTIEW
jgi:hypothetical protein